MMNLVIFLALLGMASGNLETSDLMGRGDSETPEFDVVEVEPPPESPIAIAPPADVGIGTPPPADVGIGTPPPADVGVGTPPPADVGIGTPPPTDAGASDSADKPVSIGAPPPTTQPPGGATLPESPGTEPPAAAIPPSTAVPGGASQPKGATPPVADPAADPAGGTPSERADGRVPESQAATGKFLNASEVRMILDQTKGSWISVRNYEGRDILYFTNLLAWRCGLYEITYAVNGGAFEVLEAEPCYEDEAVPNALRAETILPYVEFPPASVETVTIHVLYDDLSEDEVTLSRQEVEIN